MSESLGKCRRDEDKRDVPATSLYCGLMQRGLYGYYGGDWYRIYVIFEFLAREARKKDYVSAADGDNNRALPNGVAYFRGRGGQYGSFARGETFPDSFRWVYRCRWENVCRATTMPDRSITSNFSLSRLCLQKTNRVVFHERSIDFYAHRTYKRNRTMSVNANFETISDATPFLKWSASWLNKQANWASEIIS